MSAQEHFDSIEKVDPKNGYAERDVAWFREFILPDLRILKDTLLLGPSLLDVGCAAGYFTRIYAGEFANVHGIDFSPTRIAQARKINRPKTVGYERVDITARSVFARFDSAISSAVFQHIDPTLRAEAFRNIQRSLKPGAFLVLYDALTETQPNPPIWDGYTELLSIAWLRDLDSFGMMEQPEFIATDGGGFRIHRVVLKASA